MADKRLMKMFLLNEDTFRKLKERLAEEKKYNELDKGMNDVLTKNVSDNDKWLMYRHELYKFLNNRRNVMDYDDLTKGKDATKPSKKKSNFFNLPVRKPKKYTMATSTSDLASYINPKRHQDMQTDPWMWKRRQMLNMPTKWWTPTICRPERKY